jgi:hypothetical protein
MTDEQLMRDAYDALCVAVPGRQGLDEWEENESLRAALRERLAQLASGQEPLSEEDERVAFESHWYNFYHAGSVSSRPDGRYVGDAVQRAWEAWQARAANSIK